MLYRHGDVLIADVAEIPEGGQQRPTPILAYGEATGHAHRVESPDKGEVWEVNGQLFLRLTATTRIIHEEHQPITLPPGTYRVWQQREYTPQAVRTIRD